MAAVPLARSSVVITTVNFFTDNGEVALRCIKRIGLPRIADGWDLNYRLHLACRTGAPEPEMFGGVLVLRRFAGRFPNHLESHSRGNGCRVQCRPARLIDHRNVLNLKREGVAVGTDTQTTLGNRNDPVKPRRRNGRVGEARGYEYVAITDHSKGLKIAGGIDEEQLAKQADEIAIVNESLRSADRTIRILLSIEVNLSPRAEVDMDFSSLAKLDIVLGCFHSALRKKEDQTDRYVAALRNPAIHILGHPRGRIYNFRGGLSADWAKVFGMAAELDKAVEIDSYPDRQDLSLDLVRLAGKAGCRISLGTDAHGASQLRFVEFGLASALKALSRLNWKKESPARI
jgi:histidinol phosphatase-like PHP family hydrolase